MKPLLTLVALLCVGCSEEQHKMWEERRQQLEANTYGMSRVKFGNCEYIRLDTGSGANGTGAGICHAGDCPNPIHKENKQ